MNKGYLKGKRHGGGYLNREAGRGGNEYIGKTLKRKFGSGEKKKKDLAGTLTLL